MRTDGLVVTLFCALAAVVVRADLGIDVAYPYEQSAWNCLREKNITFVIIRCYQSLGRVDPSCVESVAKARAAGFRRVDLYMFPCPTCGNATGQVRDLHRAVTAGRVDFDYLWLDIEGPKYWLGDYGKNRAFFTELSDASLALFGPRLGGVYCNKNGWEELMGVWSGGASFPLWWAYWDSTGPTWDAWKPFDGWNSRPAIKQYHGGTYLCDMHLDLDFF